MKVKGVKGKKLAAIAGLTADGEDEDSELDEDDLLSDDDEVIFGAFLSRFL